MHRVTYKNLHELRRRAVNARDLNDHWMVMEYRRALAGLIGPEVARLQSEASIEIAYQKWAATQRVPGSDWSLLAHHPHLF